MATQQIDEAKQEAFAQEMLTLLNHAFVAEMVSIGHQTGLFDKMAELPPSTSQELADAAGLNERYVREWLGAVTVAGMVEYDPANRTYRLPREHAAFLTRAAGPNNMATFAQYLPLIGLVESKVIDSFRKGGGVHPSNYERFQELQREDSAQLYDAALVDQTLPLVTGLPGRLEQGIDVLDVGCGAGHAINLMARAFPNSRFTGLDIADDGIALGRREAEEWGLTNADFVVQDVVDLKGQWDLITAFDAIHDMAQPTRALKAIADILAPDGVFLMVDIGTSSHLERNLDHPFGPFLYSISVMYCMTVSLAFDGEGLGTVWGEELARQKLAEARFTKVEAKRIEDDPVNLYYICRKS